MPGTRPRDRPSPLELLDGTAFVLAGAAATWLALLILTEGLALDWRMLLVVAFWVIAAYLALPRVHRVLTYLYLPGYFIGRARTSDGLLGDPVNLALRGDEQQVHQVMERAGWVRADEVTLASGMRIVTTTLRRVSYPEAPVSPLHLFERPQDFAYQQEVAGNPAQRHHVRFWHCPTGWLLPGGEAVDWLAAGSYDRTVGLSLFTLQVTHRIAQDIDVERDFIVAEVTATSPEITEHRLASFSSGYHSHNGGGDRIETDGDLPVLELDRVVAPPPAPAPLPPPILRAPPPTVFGAAVAAGRAGCSPSRSPLPWRCPATPRGSSPATRRQPPSRPPPWRSPRWASSTSGSRGRSSGAAPLPGCCCLSSAPCSSSTRQSATCPAVHGRRWATG